MKKGLAVFSGSAVVHKLMQDGTVVLGTAANWANVTVSGNINVVGGSLTASADRIEVGVVSPLTSSVLDDIIVELYNKAAGDSSALSSSLKAYVDAQDTALQGNLDSVSSSLKSHIDAIDSAQTTANDNLSSSLKSYVDAIDSAQTTANDNLSSSLKSYVDAQDSALSGAVAGEVSRLDGRINTLIGSGSIAETLDTIKEIADFLDGDGAAAADLTTRVADISGALAQEIIDRGTAVSGVQTNLDSVSSSLKSHIDAIDSAQTTANDNLSSSLKSYVDAIDSAQTTANDNLSSSLKAHIDAVDSAQTTANDNLSSSLKSYVDAQDTALSSSMKSYVDAIDSAQTTANDNLSSSLKSYVDAIDSAQTTANDNLSSSLKAHIDAVDSAQTTANDNLSSSLKSYVDAVDSAQTTANDNLSSSLKSYVDAIDSAQTTANDNLSSSLKSYVDAQDTALSSSFDTRLDTLETTVQAIIGDSATLETITASLNSIKEIAEFLDGDGAAAADLTTRVADISGALSQEISDRGTAVSNLSSSVSSSLAAETAARIAAGSDLQAQLDASAFTVNGLSVLAKSGSFSIVTGSSNNLNISSVGSTVTVDLNSSVTLAGTLTANVVSASAGLDVVGGASVAGGLTLSSGDLAVSAGNLTVSGSATVTGSVTVASGDVTVSSGNLAVNHGTIKSVLVSGTDDTEITALFGAAATSNGQFFYLSGEAVGGFPRGNCWYFCQEGLWFDAPFFQE